MNPAAKAASTMRPVEVPSPTKTNRPSRSAETLTPDPSPILEPLGALHAQESSEDLDLETQLRATTYLVNGDCQNPLRFDQLTPEQQAYVRKATKQGTLGTASSSCLH